MSALDVAVVGCGPRMRLGLNSLLGLAPLDRVQIAPIEVRRECRRDGSSWPWRFFQRPLSDGRIEVAGEGGAIAWVDPSEVVDRQTGQPIAVRAWSPARYRGFFSVRGHQEIERYCAQSEFHDAHVMRLEHDRWGRVDRVYVWFAEASLNEQISTPFPARLHDEDRHALASVTRRTCPVSRPSGRGNWSSDQGLQAQSDRVERRVRSWLRASLNGLPGDGHPIREDLLHLDALSPSQLKAVDRRIRPVLR